MSTCWLRQKQLAFNTSYIDYITCTQFVVLPNDDNEHNDNQSSKFTEVLYIGCNNGSVIACDVSSLPPADNNNTDAKNTKMDVGSHLFLLYRHQQGGVDTRGSSSSRTKSKTTATSGTGGGGLFDDADDNNKNIINDEVSGCSVFALCQYETLFASCGDDKRCVISMMPESHPPFFLSNNKIRKEEILRKRNTSKALVDDRNQNEKLESLAAICPIQDLQPPLVAVIEEASPVRCVQLFGGRKTWVDEFPEDEASTVYCATGGEDGYLRVYRVDVSGSDNSNIGNTDNNNNSGNPLSFSYWQKKTSRAVELLWVVSMSAGTASMVGSSSNHSLLLSSHSSSSNTNNNKMISFKHSTLDDDVLELTASSSASATTSNNNVQSSSDTASRHHPFICSLLFDEDTEMFLVGTQSGVCLCDCLPKTNPKYYRGKHERDLGRKATNESWMNSSVWALSEHELKNMATATATATTTGVVEQQHSSSSSSLPPMPLRSIKSKFLNLYHSARSIGTVVEVLAETNQGDQQRQTEENTNNSNDNKINKNLAMLKVMFPSISGSKKKSEAATSDHCVILPQHAIRRVCRPRYFLTTSGGPYFAMSIVKNNNNNQTKETHDVHQTDASSSSSALTCAIAGAASNGEVLLVRISTPDENNSNSTGSTLNGDVTISLLCRFRAGKDLIKSIVCLNSSVSSSSSSISLLCGSYDGTMSEWLLARDENNNQQEEEEELMIPIRRCVQLVESIDGKKEESSHNTDNNKTVSIENLVKYKNLLSSFENNNNNQSLSNNSGEDTSSSSSSGVGTLHFFPGAGVLFSSCLFERTMQTFILGLKDGPFELPRGLIFNGYKTVRVDDENENDGGDLDDDRETGVPEILLNEGRELEKGATKNKKR